MNLPEKIPPVVSIIVPVYCMEKHLNRCIDSIMKQTYRNYELILVDDGSTDHSGYICDYYAARDQRVRTYHKKNGGVGDAKNFGIERADGKYITFIDSDDFISPEYLHVLINASNLHQTDLVIGGIYYCNETDLKVTSSLNLPDKFIIREEFKTELPQVLDLRGLNYHVAKLYRKAIIDKHYIRFTDFKETGADDTIFNFEFLKFAQNIKIISSNIYHYIIYNNSTSHRFSTNKWIRSKILDKNLTSICEEIGVLTPEMMLSLDNRIILSAIWSANSIITDSGFGIFRLRKELKSISYDPRLKRALLNPKVTVPKSNKFLFEHNWIGYYMLQSRIQDRIKAKILKIIPKGVYTVIKKHILRK